MTAALPITGLFLIALLGLLYVGKVVLMPVAFALVIALVLRPTVRALSKVWIPASVASALVLAAIIGGAGVGVMQLSEPAVEWAEKMPRALRLVEQRTRPLRKPVEDVSELAGSVDRLIQVNKGPKPREVALDRPGLMEVGMGAIAELSAGALAMLIALYFMLIASPESFARILGFTRSTHDEESAVALVRRLEQQVSQYLRVVVVINASLGLAVGAVLAAVGMPNPLLWGVLAAVLTFVPYLGPLLGVLAVALASIVTFPDLAHAVVPPLSYMALATIEGNLITPLVVGRRLKIHPLILFVWLLLWGALWGIGGAVLAAPMLALIKLATDENTAWAPLSRWLEG